MTPPEDVPNPSGRRRAHRAPTGGRLSWLRGALTAPTTPAGRALAVGALAMGAFALACLVLLGWDAFLVQRSIDAAERDVGSLEALVLAGDQDEIGAAIASLQDHTGSAASVIDGRLWRWGARAPIVGPSFTAVRESVDIADDLANEALPAIGEAAAVVNPAALAPRDGRVDLQPLIDATPRIDAGHAAVLSSVARLEQLETSNVVFFVAWRVDELRAMVDEVAMTTATAARAAHLLPPMMGAEGPRSYLLLALNNAELRSAGGIVGAVVLLEADDGAVSIIKQVPGNKLRSPEPILPLEPDEAGIYGERLARFMANATMTPDFPRSAEFARALWVADGGEEPDGVLALDPVALQYLLSATGPVSTASGKRLTEANAADFLLNGVYRTLATPADQDAFFANAAEDVFGALTEGRSDAVKAVRALGRAASERRLLVWSAHPEEQELLQPTVLSGELRGAEGDVPIIGVYLNDGTGAKMSYYLHYTVGVERTACFADGGREVLVTIDFDSTAPADAATLPPYLTGPERRVPTGTIRTNVGIYGPSGGTIRGALVDGEPAGIATFLHEGLAVGLRTVELAPGESTSLQVRVTIGPDQRESVRLRVTPGSTPTELSKLDQSCR